MNITIKDLKNNPSLINQIENPDPIIQKVAYEADHSIYPLIKNPDFFVQFSHFVNLTKKTLISREGFDVTEELNNFRNLSNDEIHAFFLAHDPYYEAIHNKS